LVKFVFLTAVTMLRVAAADDDSDRKLPLVWKGPFLEKFDTDDDNEVKISRRRRQRQ